ncbi:2-octaprenyl-6-methoxyphenyl hydroxylase [Legionella worsleiensis]|uniref:2-octaprenyl-6-methoxyphenol hydroxylase n=1 Tax=Legionella worsleiensis TaxID=45076 RepID=A0A0W1AJN1_9GAMM|nr:2-octaprenyl-6-methoxyphenyl hydroxylase [Legionella worsleiensis]KTD81575.1 2-octaprenyl-6-methoxyphenol hydroxylase [Legionella worsleiensis]STY32135.1 2-octaprenyl-6-methoxyphenol hydroxylase [Legionella worsleiensis]
MADQQTDILIVGGGLAGATLMLELQDLGYKTLLVESKPFSDKVNPDFDARTIALSPASKTILNMLGVWGILQEYATPISMIHVSDQHRFGASRLWGDEANPLGYVVEIQYINRALHQLLDKNQIVAPASVKALSDDHKTVTVMTESGEITIAAQLIVAADGTDSKVRQLCHLTAQTKTYNHYALVANVALQKAHDYKAYERFTAHGPLALLPMQGNKMSLVWAVPPEQAQVLTGLKDDLFLKELQRAFGYRLGRFTQVGKRFTYPLRQVLMPQQTQWPVVFVGNAAHTLHPVAGQGFNLGIRDVAVLAQCIAHHGLNASMLERYMQLRQHDQKMIARFTDGLIQLFTTRLPGVSLLRNIGLIALDNSTVLKNILAHYARGYGGVIPDLVCEIPLSKQEFL